MTRTILILGYLGAIVVANLTLAEWGREHPEVVLYNAFILVAYDLVARDYLHSYWEGPQLVRNMAALIGAGSLLSLVAGYWIGSGPDVGRIALASCIAFGAAGVTDALVYTRMISYGWLERINGSNIASATVDSFVFIALYPFGFDFTLAFTLAAVKIAGGVTWSLVLKTWWYDRLESRRMRQAFYDRSGRNPRPMVLP